MATSRNNPFSFLNAGRHVQGSLTGPSVPRKGPNGEPRVAPDTYGRSPGSWADTAPNMIAASTAQLVALSEQGGAHGRAALAELTRRGRGADGVPKRFAPAAGKETPKSLSKVAAKFRDGTVKTLSGITPKTGVPRWFSEGGAANNPAASKGRGGAKITPLDDTQIDWDDDSDF